eukprot:199807_1
MSTVTFAVVVLTINTFLSQPYEEMLATNNTRFNAKDYSKSIKFNAPKNGTITGIRLNHVSGYVTCGTLSKNPTTNWGCFHDGGTPKFFTVFLHVTHDYYGTVYYPTADTQGVSISNNSAQPGDPYYYGDCARGCIFPNYNVSGHSPITSPNFTLFEPSYNVTINDEFMLQFTEACCPSAKTPGGSKASYDNQGTAWVKVFFLYKTPTIAPTISPTFQLNNETHGVKVSITYNFDNIAMINYVVILSNVTRDALIGNFSESVTRCITNYTDNIKNVTTFSMTIEAVIMTCDANTQQMLVAHYTSNLKVTLIHSINDTHKLLVTSDNIHLEVDKIGGIISTTLIMTTEESMIIGSNNGNKTMIFTFVYIGVSLLLVICCVCVIVIAYNKKKKVIKQYVLYTTNDLQLGLLNGEDDKTDTVNVNNGESYAGTFRDMNKMLSTGSEALYGKHLCVDHGKTDKGTTKGYTKGYDKLEGNQDNVNRTDGDLVDDEFVIDDDTKQMELSTNDKQQMMNYNKQQSVLDTDGFIGDIGSVTSVASSNIVLNEDNNMDTIQ